MAAPKKNNTNKLPSKMASQKPKTTQIIKVIDDKLLETGKHYLLLGQANQLLLSEEIITDKEHSNKLLNQLLEANEIPHAYQIETKPKQWRIPLSKVGEQRRKLIKKNTTKAKKTTLKTPTKKEKVEITETNPMKIFWYAITVICCIIFLIVPPEMKTDNPFWWCVLIVAIIAFFIAKSIKPITKTITNNSSSYAQQNFLNYNEDTQNKQNTYNPIIINKTVRINESNTKQNSQLNENEIHNLVNDFAGEGIEDEVRDYLDYEREERHDHHSQDKEVESDFDDKETDRG